MISIRNLHKSFGTKRVLRGIDLEIADGETVAIIGQSGCGKSVLLKHIIGLMKPDDGEVLVDGVNINLANERQLRLTRRHFGFLFQSAALFDSMTVADNITLGLREHGERDREKLAHIVNEKLALVGLRGIAENMPAELSGGMKKRVGLARALASEPKYMFYDEPTTGLDPVSSDQIDNVIRDLTSKLRVTSLIVTHDMFTVERIARRVVFLHEGRIYSDRSASEFYQSSDATIQQFIERYKSPTVELRGKI